MKEKKYLKNFMKFIQMKFMYNQILDINNNLLQIHISLAKMQDHITDIFRFSQGDVKNICNHGL